MARGEILEDFRHKLLGIFFVFAVMKIRVNLGYQIFNDAPNLLCFEPKTLHAPRGDELTLVVGGLGLKTVVEQVECLGVGSLVGQAEIAANSLYQT